MSLAFRPPSLNTNQSLYFIQTTTRDPFVLHLGNISLLSYLHPAGSHISSLKQLFMYNAGDILSKKQGIYHSLSLVHVTGLTLSKLGLSKLALIQFFRDACHTHTYLTVRDFSNTTYNLCKDCNGV